MTASPASGPVVFAYDGSELAKLAIDEAGRLFGQAKDEAITLTIWQPFDVGFVPAAAAIELDSSQVEEVRQISCVRAPAPVSAPAAP